MTLILITAPAVEPITLAEARLHLKLETTGSPAANADDDLIDGLITGIREHLDGPAGILGRALCTQTWDLMLKEFPSDDNGDAPIKIPLPPLQYVNFIQYMDDDGLWQTLAASNYQITGGNAFRPAKIYPAYNEVWPSVRDRPEAVRVRFTAGYLDNSSPGDTQEGVPAAIKAGMKMMLGHLYENREAVNIGSITTELPLGTQLLFAPYRVSMFA